MSRVRILPDDLVSLISAGEVIENPSSIVKELIENSLDAEAKNIEIEILEGGIKSIKVSDDGIGIHPDDCMICIQRHSTSKITSRSDIDSIHTYGFRGEALASVAAVADISIRSRQTTSSLGIELIANQGETPVRKEISRPEGTTIEMANLFSRIPARRKHLDSPSREAQRIHEIIMKHAIIRNEVGFRFIRDGVVVIDVPLNQSKRDRVLELWGLEIVKSLIEINHTEDSTHIRGFLVQPPLSRGNRQREYLSIRKRPIEERRLSLAVEEAYSTLLMSGRYPIFALDIDVDVELVDANVHPTKREVRIENIDTLIRILHSVVRDALEPSIKSVSQTLDEFVESSISKQRETIMPAEVEGRQSSIIVEEGLLQPKSLMRDEVEGLGGRFRVIGQVSRLYLLIEMEEGLVIIDQHAAHERILYEKLRDKVNSGSVMIQELLEPIVIRLDSVSIEQILEVAEVLKEVGYSVAEFGGNEILISSLPEILQQRANEIDMISLVDRIIELGVVAKDKFMDEIIRVTACHAAIRAGEVLDHRQIQDLIVKLSKTSNQNYCCHGRPSMVRVTRSELDKRFGRDGIEALKRYRARHRIE